MKELNIGILYGIEIILKYNDLFLQILESGLVDKINCSINKETLFALRDSYGEKYYQDNYDTAKFIMTDERINITHDQTYECLDTHRLKNKFNVTESFNIVDVVPDKIDLELPEEYITISTKIQIFPHIELYNQFKNILFHILNKTNYKIVILGERKLESCKEFDIHKPYVIYDDLINNLNNYIDLTIDSSINNNDLEPLKQTFYILNKSKLNIYMSWSGIKSISLYTSDNICALSEYTNHNIKNRSNKDNIHLTNDIDSFINTLNQKINHA